MGLDMYITAEKYLSNYSDNGSDVEKINKLNEMFGITNSSEDYRAETVVFGVAYWRKANAIHGWFVHNVQGDKDKCQKSWVSRERLQQLVSTCKEVLSDHTKAETLLPPMGGFFFGSTDIDDGYFTDLKDTVDQIERILNDKALEKMDFYYHSSW